MYILGKAVLFVIRGRTSQYAGEKHHDTISSDLNRQGDNKMFIEIDSVTFKFSVFAMSVLALFFFKCRHFIV